jgi:hypothetical protein
VNRATGAGVALLTGGMLTIGAAYAATIAAGVAPAWAPWAVAVGGAAASVAMFVLGAAARGRVGRGVTALLVALFVLLVGAFWTALALPASESPRGPLLLGLPLRLGIVFWGVGFVPLFALPLAFALTFRARARS